MDCPYCYSELHPEALVCKTCLKDLYLYKPLLSKIELLESQTTKAASEEYEAKIAVLESQIIALQVPPVLPKPVSKAHKIYSVLREFTIFLLIPLMGLLLAHWLITIVYDTKMLYLRVISILLPMPFGFFLFSKKKRSFVTWVIAILLLSALTVLGMSYVNSLVDHSLILPQNNLELREFFEYAVSIGFSFTTGMVLGHLAFQIVRERKDMEKLKNSQANMNNGVTGKVEIVVRKVTKLNEVMSIFMAVITTLVSIYTGLKTIL